MTHDATGTADAGVHHVGIAALTGRPRGATHWSVRELGDETGISKSTAQRYLALFGVQPHRSKSFKLSTRSPTSAWSKCCRLQNEPYANEPVVGGD